MQATKQVPLLSLTTPSLAPDVACKASKEVRWGVMLLIETKFTVLSHQEVHLDEVAFFRILMVSLGMDSNGVGIRFSARGAWAQEGSRTAEDLVHFAKQNESLGWQGALGSHGSWTDNEQPAKYIGSLQRTRRPTFFFAGPHE